MPACQSRWLETIEMASSHSEVPLPATLTHPTARLFFAIWPDNKTRELLDQAGKQLHAACGGRRTRRETIHITLVFLGDVPIERIDALRALAGRVAAPQFKLVLTKLGWWKHNRVAWAAPDATPDAMAELVRGLETELTGKTFQLDARPYLPHATLVRKATCHENMALDVSISWEVGDFVLVRSVTDAGGAAYEVIGRWPLGKRLTQA